MLCPRIQKAVGDDIEDGDEKPKKKAPRKRTKVKD